MKYISTWMMCLIFSLQANAAEQGNSKSAYEEWKEGRLERLMEPHGWLSLVGLEWLHVGANSIGSAADNMIQLSHGPDYLGQIVLQRDNSLRFIPELTSGIKANDELVTGPMEVFADSDEQGATVFTVDTYEFFVVERDKMGVRIKDSEAITRTGFLGLEYFPEDTQFRIDADFIAYEPAKLIPTVNVLGILTNQESPGRLEFTIDGVDYSLDALDSDDSYYMIFGDKTNGKTTYGPGRFLYTDGKVDEAGKVRIDFNKAYNPPCSFTAYSTCTLPPLQNRLPVAIEAGEKKYANSTY
ncbi:DUF1684 domain-containing protein [Marinicella sp. S1101]|uniref:DUF1684 domain-containing protein n=1 Tax=Marinicella marina TaxID=2996016 RepID=UPI0022609341|nr:DUF1684 domain-containing protein [Marinicella marina]MCX7554175.1 DUF1684 domain-containing protein [Marinicella marina]MDJ1141132.1 DUF1684 domain-containing protein [Marinicella marina]